MKLFKSTGLVVAMLILFGINVEAASPEVVITENNQVKVTNIGNNIAGIELKIELLNGEFEDNSFKPESASSYTFEKKSDNELLIYSTDQNDISSASQIILGTVSVSSDAVFDTKSTIKIVNDTLSMMVYANVPVNDLLNRKLISLPDEDIGGIEGSHPDTPDPQGESGAVGSSSTVTQSLNQTEIQSTQTEEEIIPAEEEGIDIPGELLNVWNSNYDGLEEAEVEEGTRASNVLYYLLGTIFTGFLLGNVFIIKGSYGTRTVTKRKRIDIKHEAEQLKAREE